MSFLSSLVSNIAAEQVLTERDVAALLLLVYRFSDKWYNIGIGMGFTLSELNVIESKPLLLSGAPTRYLTELLNQWIQWPTENHPNKPTLRALCEALRSSLVGLGSLADEVEREMGKYLTGKVLLATDILMHKYYNLVKDYGLSTHFPILSISC